MRLVAVVCVAIWAATPGCRPERTAGRLVVATDAPVRSLDPRLAVDNASAKVSRLVFEGLTEVDKRGMPQLVLAETIEPGRRKSAAGEPLHYVVRVRRGVKFHSGRELTGRDVAYTYQSVMDPDFKAIIAGAFRRRFRSVRVDPDDAQVVHFELRRPLATFLTDIVLGIAPASLANQPDQRFTGQPNGTGPWRIAEDSTNERVVLQRFDGHRSGHRNDISTSENERVPPGDGKPSSIVFASIVDEGSRALSILGAGADLAIGGISPAVLDSAASSGLGKVKRAPGIAWAYMGLNLRLQRLADVRVRRAIAMAIDRQAIIDGLLGGRARIAEGMMAPEHWAHVPLPKTRFDPAAAKALLDAAGFPEKNGKPRFSLDLKVSTNRLRRSVGAAVSRDLAAVGIATTVRSYEIGTFLADVRAGRFDAFLLILPEPLEPDFLAWMFHSQNAPQKAPDVKATSRFAKLDRRALMPGVFSAQVSDDPDCGPWSRGAVAQAMAAFALAPLGLAESFGSANRTSYHDPITSCLLELGRGTSKRNERKRLYARAQRRIAKAVPVVPLWFEDQVALVRNGVQVPPLTMDGRFGVLKDARVQSVGGN